MDIPKGGIFWSMGNAPTQKINRLDPETLRLSLYAQILLSDCVYGSASYFFESELTQQILTRHNFEIARTGRVRLFVGHDVEDFEHHAVQKGRKSPEGLAAYGASARELGRELDRVTRAHHRRPSDMSARISEMWLTDIQVSSGTSLGNTIAWLADNERNIAEWTGLFASVTINRQQDFVWEYVGPRLQRGGCPEWALRRSRERLSELYVIASSEADELVPDRIVAIDGEARSKTDPIALLEVFKAIRAYDDFKSLSYNAILRLRDSAPWRSFLTIYEDVLNSVTVSAYISEAASIYGMLDAAEARITTALPASRRSIADSLNILLQKSLAIGSYDLLSLTDKIRAVSELFGTGPIALLREHIRVESMHAERRIEMHEPSGCRAFIVHGHDRQMMLETKDYLQNVLGLPEPIVLAQRASGGLTIIEKFESYSEQVDVAIVLLSPDDHLDGENRARQNVVFELGYFLGKFGRRSGRVVCLHKGTVAIPSDLAGIIYVDVSNGVESAGEQIRKELAKLPLAREESSS